MKGLFIPEITSEMFKNGCLESIETLMAEGEIYDIEYSRWIPVSERLPEEDELYLVYTEEQPFVCEFENGEFFIDDVLAWMPLPEPYKAEGSDKV